MRKLTVRGMLALALCAGLALAAKAADDDETPPAPSTGIGGWWNGLFGAKEKPVEKVEKKEEPVEKPTGPSAAERVEIERRRELNAYFRRLKVCDKLMEIAILKDDLDTQRRVEELTEKVATVCQQRLAALGNGDDDMPPPKAKAGGSRGSKRFANTGEDNR